VNESASGSDAARGHRSPGRAHLIGSIFPLEPIPSGTSRPPPFARAGSLLTANATCALYLLLRRRRPARIWLPSYLCPIITTGTQAAGIPHAFYDVDEALATPIEALAAMGPRDMVLVIHYFGFRNPLAEALRRSGWPGLILEDASHALLTTGLGRDGDGVLYSPRKFLGVPDGGILWLADEEASDKVELLPPPSEWWRTQVRAASLRRDFDSNGGGDREWFRLSQRAQHIHPIGPYRMSPLTTAILWGGFDFASLAERRRANHRYLLERLPSIALLPDLPDEVVPFGFPIVSDRRDAIRAALFAERIYPSVHWPIQGHVPERHAGSHRLAARLLTIPIDQRYGPDDLERIADIVERFARSGRAQASAPAPPEGPQAA
jgi:dTDP-4-amino-4,6-dideoxygalactose transaminase